MKVEIIFENRYWLKKKATILSFRQYLKYFKLQLLVFLRNSNLFYQPQLTSSFFFF